MRQKTQNVLGTSLVVKTPVAKTHTPKAGGLGSILGQGTRSHITQLRVCMLHLKKITHASSKIEDSKRCN